MNKLRKESIPLNIKHRKNPFLALQDELDRAISSFYNTATPANELGFRNFENLVINPFIDVVEDKENFKIEAEMPGIDEKAVQVSIHDGTLTIKAEKEISKKDEGKNYMRREIGYGRYERNIELPDTADVDRATASFKKGMLWITIPKKSESIKKSREIKVEKIGE